MGKKVSKKVSKKVKRYNKKRTKRKVNYNISKNKRKIRKKYKTRKQKRIKSVKLLESEDNYDRGGIVFEKLMKPTAALGAKVIRTIAGPGGKDAQTIRAVGRMNKIQGNMAKRSVYAGLQEATKYIEDEHK